MNMAVATDFAGSTGSPKLRLEQISRAGFTHLHWCHQWCTDFLYGEYEIRQIKEWLSEVGLKLLDIHGSQGQEKCWYSLEEYQRKAGVELVANRMKMLRDLDGTGALMMHIPVIHTETPAEERPRVMMLVDALKKSLDELMPLSRELKVPIAVENMREDTFEIIEKLLGEYPADFLGLCFDCGHGNIGSCQGLDHLEVNKGRLMALHLHDNDGSGDLHQQPFMGTVDWERLAKILKASAYTREISFELSRGRSGFKEGEEDAFLADAYQRCLKFTRMVRPE